MSLLLTGESESKTYTTSELEYLISSRKKLKLRKFFQTWRVRRFLSENLRGYSNVLEIGSGLGYLSDLLPGHLRVYHSDISMEAGQEAKGRKPSIDYLVIDANQMPFNDGNIEAVIGNNVLDCIYPLNRVVEEVYRVLTPNGKVLHLADFVPCTEILCKWLNDNKEGKFIGVGTIDRSDLTYTPHMLMFGSQKEEDQYNECIMAWADATTREESRKAWDKEIELFQRHKLSNRQCMDYFSEMLRNAFEPHFHVEIGRLSLQPVYWGVHYMRAEKKH